MSTENTGSTANDAVHFQSQSCTERCTDPVGYIEKIEQHLVVINQIKELVCANLVLEVLVTGHLDDGVQMGLHLLLSSSLLLLSLSLTAEHHTSALL